MKNVLVQDNSVFVLCSFHYIQTVSAGFYLKYAEVRISPGSHIIFQNLERIQSIWREQFLVPLPFCNPVFPVFFAEAEPKTALAK